MKIQRLLQLLDTVSDPSLRKPFLELSLAIELAYAVALPSAPVESLTAHFEQYHAELVKRVLGEVNEMYPFSVNVAYNLVLDVYRTRYNVCHCPELLSAQSIATILSQSELTKALTPVHIETLHAGGYVNLVRSEFKEFIGRFII